MLVPQDLVLGGQTGLLISDEDLGKNAEAMETPGDWDRFHVEMVVLLDVLVGTTVEDIGS